MAEKTNVPEIRFAGFTDPWEQRKLGDITSSYSGGTPQANNPDYYNGSIPFIRSAEINADKTELYLTEKGLAESSAALVDAGCILYALYGATSGEAGISRINGAINQAILAIYPYAGFDSGFLASWLRREKDAIVATYLQGGQGNLSGAIVKNFKVPVPGLPEQKAIGDCLSSLDNLITLHQRKYDKLAQLKKSMLDKMFPKPGERFPEIRFAGFTDPWEQRKLGELGSVAMCKRIFKEQTTEQGDVPFYKIGTFGGTPDAFISRELFDEYQRLYQFPKVGDILISAAGTIGRTIVYQGDPAYYQDSNIVWLQHDERLDNGFLLQFLNGKSWSSLEGSTLKRLYNKDLLNAEIAIPSPDEQHQIGSTFARLDGIITLHQRKLELLRNTKKSLLDRMFV